MYNNEALLTFKERMAEMDETGSLGTEWRLVRYGVITKKN